MPEVPGSTASDFLAQLESVPWFSNIGRPTPPDAGVKRISAWEEWPGPKEPGVGELSFRHQDLYDRIMAESGDRRESLTQLWEAIHAAVFRRAASQVPYDPEQDTWHGPTMAVWQAAWTAGLVGLCLQTGRPVPPELQEQWSWYARGHWPAGYASLGPDGRLGPLLVY
jgi:hypothetical protein